MKINRRSFLRNSVAAGAALGFGFETVAQAPDWDRSADVLVVGCGGAGALAALAASEEGARCMVLEKMPFRGGTTLLSGGLTWLPNNPIAAQSPDHQDSVDDVIAYLTACARGQCDQELIRVFAESAADTAKYLIDSLDAPYSVFGAWDYHPRYPGARQGRGLRPETGSGGAALMKLFSKALDSRRIPTLTSTPVRRLLLDERKRILGVVADAGGTALRVEARKGVILTTGGFGWNEAMKREYLKMYPLPCVGQKGSTGDGIRLGMSMGAALGNMNEMCGSPVLDLPGLIRPLLLLSGRRNGILVNRSGRRFCDESKDYDTVITAFHRYDARTDSYLNLPAYLILDRKGLESGPIPYDFCPDWSEDNQAELAKGWIRKANTIEDLATRLGIDGVGLSESIRRVNSDVSQGQGDEFHRGEEPDSTPLEPLSTSPYYGVEIVPGLIDTMGGLKINAQAQVLDVFGEPISALFAAGATAHQAWGFYYPAGGSFLGQNFVFGRIAGKSATL
jgi:flavocytochrome c